MDGLSHPLSWWLSNDIVLSQGQKGLVIDQGYYKIGDGLNKFSGLPYDGLRSIDRWFSYTYSVYNQAGLLSTLYSPHLVGGTFIIEGDWMDFEFKIVPTNNSNTKTIDIKFANQLMFTFNITTNSSDPIVITGRINCYNYNGKVLSYKIRVESDNTSPRWFFGKLNNIDFTQNNSLLLQGQSIADNDILGDGAEGSISVIKKM